MNKRYWVLPALFLFILLASSALSAQVESPEDFLGFKVGTDRKTADMHQILEYFLKLDQASERVLVKEIGKTEMGNPFIVAFITSEANQRRLDRYREIQQKLADPRSLADAEAETMIAEGRAIVMINCSIHASEIGASQMSMRLAYDLAVGDDPATRRILDNVILLLTPMHNPDGIQLVVDWYRKYLGTEYEGGRMPWLYNKYVGHDNNRDWFMFTQAETRLTIKVHNAWHPQVIVDMHQMGGNGARIFVPPFVDPYEPNVDPILRQQVAAMGTFLATELTAQGMAGVEHSYRYDGWTPARAYHHYHGGIRILTEVASVRLATPVTVDFDRLSPGAKQESVRMAMPWKGGAWTLGDIVDYDYAAAVAALTHASGLRENWVRNYHRIFRKAVEPKTAPFAYLVPPGQRDPSTALKMLEILHMGGVEIHAAESAFTADGHEFPAGTHIIPMAQPFGGFAKALLERQVYPEIRDSPGGPLKTPYDVVGHTLPLLMGVEAVKVDRPIQAAAKLLERIVKPAGRVIDGEGAWGYVWGHTSNDDIVALNRLLERDRSVFWAAEAFQSGGREYPPGAMLVRAGAGLEDDLAQVTGDMLVEFRAIEAAPVVRAYSLKKPRIGLYKSWTASMDEGWTRFVLEQFEFPYRSLVDEDIRRGNLQRDFDVIILPDMGNAAIVKGVPEKQVPPEYAGGIGDVGVRSLRRFTESGGALITLNSAADFAVKSLKVGVANVASGLNRKDFFIPGSLLAVLNDVAHPIAYGYPTGSAVFFRRSPVFDVIEGSAVVRYAPEALLSGWVSGEEKLTGRGALADVPFGKGRVILIGFPAQYRSQSHATFRYLFNAVFYGAARKIDLK